MSENKKQESYNISNYFIINRDKISNSNKDNSFTLKGMKNKIDEEIQTEIIATTKIIKNEKVFYLNNL